MKVNYLQIWLAIFFLSLFSMIAIAQDEQEDLPDEATPRKIFYTYKSSSKSSSSTSTAKSKQSPKSKTSKTTTKERKDSKPEGKKDSKPVVRKKPQPGAQIKIELERNGIKQYVPSKTVFFSGDKVRFYFKVNFPAYVAVFNQGSSGKISLLFPCGGQKNLIPSQGTFRIPTGNFPFKFDDTAGEENLLFVMSDSPISLVQQALASGIDVCSSKNSETLQKKWGEIDTSALGQGRDIVLSDDEDEDGTKAAYFLTSLQSLKKVIGIKLKLIHQ